MENGLAVLELSSGWQRTRLALQSVQAWQDLTFSQEAEDLGRVNAGPGSALDVIPVGVVIGFFPHCLRLTSQSLETG